MRAIARGVDKTHGYVSDKYECLSRFFARTVTSDFNQDISFLLVGNKGTGKSFAQLSLAYHTACHIAEILGGTWQDYFNIETNLASIDPESANRVMAVQSKYAVKVFDDISIGWGSRNWQNEENKAKNDIFIINRVDNQVQMFSVPNQFLLDKVPRSLVSHYAETYQAFFKHGFVTIKLFKPTTMFRAGKVINPYLEINRNKYEVYAIDMPPPELVRRYREIRREATTIMIKRRAEAIQKEREDQKKSPRDQLNSRTRKALDKAEALVEAADKIRLKGATPSAALFEAGKEMRVHPDTIKYWIKRGFTRSLGYEV